MNTTAPKTASHTPAQAMYLRGYRASMEIDDGKDLSYWDGELGHLGNLYLLCFLDGWVDAATGLNEYRPVWFEGQPDDKGRRFDANANEIK